MGHLLRTPLIPPGEDAADHPIRLSLYSLPVPKQFVESLGRVISFAQSATCRTWQSAHFVHPVDFGSILGCRSPAFFRRHEVSLAFLLHSATHVLHAVADRLLVYVQSDIVHTRHRGASVVVL